MTVTSCITQLCFHVVAFIDGMPENMRAPQHALDNSHNITPCLYSNAFTEQSLYLARHASEHSMLQCQSQYLAKEGIVSHVNNRKNTRESSGSLMLLKAHLCREVFRLAQQQAVCRESGKHMGCWSLGRRAATFNSLQTISWYTTYCLLRGWGVFTGRGGCCAA